MSPDHYATTDELLRALAALGFESADRVRLRFGFDADSSGEAVDLARELRARRGHPVYVGPQAPGGSRKPPPMGGRPQDAAHPP